MAGRESFCRGSAIARHGRDCVQTRHSSNMAASLAHDVSPGGHARHGRPAAVADALERMANEIGRQNADGELALVGIHTRGRRGGPAIGALDRAGRTTRARVRHAGHFHAPRRPAPPRAVDLHSADAAADGPGRAYGGVGPMTCFSRAGRSGRRWMGVGRVRTAFAHSTRRAGGPRTPGVADPAGLCRPGNPDGLRGTVCRCA